MSNINEKSFICEHNAMRRKCTLCELDEVYADLNAKTAENLSLITTIESLQTDIEFKNHKIPQLESQIQWMNSLLSDKEVEIIDRDVLIESQKEEIERLKIAVHIDVSLGNTVAEMHTEIESLKAITDGLADERHDLINEVDALKDKIFDQKAIIELAVRGLERISVTFERGEMVRLAYEHLHKIKELQNGTS